MGWVEKHGSGWRGVYRDLGGRRQRGPVVMHKAAAAAWADEHTDLVHAGIDRDPRRGRLPLRDFVPAWKDARSVEATTAASDEGRLTLILAEFGDRPLEHIDALAIQGWAKRLRREDRAAATVAKYVNLLSAILSAAVVAQRIRDNPCRYVTLDPAEPGREAYLTHDQVDALIAQLSVQGQSTVDSLAVHTLAYTGLRWGEAVGLHRNRIDFLRKRMDVVEVAIEVSGERHLKAYPKGGDRRWLPLPDHLIEALSVAFAGPVVPCGLQLLDAAGNVRPHRCTGLVLATGKEIPVLSRHTWGRDRFKPALAAAKLPPEVRVHDLRHTYASWCAAAGVDMRELQRRLGHKSIRTTERYSHFYEIADANMAGLDRPGKIGKTYVSER